MQVITEAVIEASRAAVQAMAVARTDSNNRMQNAVPIITGPIMQQLMFNWEQKINIVNSKTSYER